MGQGISEIPSENLRSAPPGSSSARAKKRAGVDEDGEFASEEEAERAAAALDVVRPSVRPTFCLRLSAAADSRAASTRRGLSSVPSPAPRPLLWRESVAAQTDIVHIADLREGGTDGGTDGRRESTWRNCVERRRAGKKAEEEATS